MQKSKELQIIKSNKLINAREKKPLSALEQKILLQCIILTDEETFNNEHTIRIQELFSGGKINNLQYNAFRKACEMLSGTVIAFEEFENGEWTRGRYIPVFRQIHADKKRGFGTFVFNDLIKDHIVGLKNNFTEYNYKHIQDLNSGFAVRVYELLIQGKNKYRSREFSIESLLDTLSVGQMSAYSKFSNVKKNILDKSCDEITEKTDINATWEVSKKQGRKITHITFLWDYKQKGTSKKERSVEAVKTQKKTKVLDNPQFSDAEVKKMDAMKHLGMNHDTIIQAILSDRKINNQVKQVTLPQADKQALLLQRLLEQKLPEDVAHKIVETTQATKESGIWAELNTLKIKIRDGQVSSPGGYLLSIAKDKNWI